MEALRLELAKIQDEEKSISETQCRTIKNLCDRLIAATSEVEQCQEINRALFADLEVRKKRVAELNTKSNISNTFAVFLIDGDDTPFIDELVKNRSEGGETAARLLRGKAQSFLQDKLHGQPDLKVLIQIYANLEGLAKTYVQCHILEHLDDMTKFVQGFNKSHVLCDFIDAGNDKEAADSKIQERIDLFYNNIHCKKIVLGVSRDNSYTSYLRTFPLVDGKNNRITILQSKPFTYGLAEVATRFGTLTVENLFRTITLSNPRARNVQFRSGHRSTIAEPEILPLPPAGALETGNISQAVNDTNNPSPKAERKSLSRSMFFNKFGHRIDPDVIFDSSSTMILSLRKRNLCYQHFLSCCEKKDCRMDHNATLSSSECEALRVLARRTPCDSTFCRDINCVRSHRCPRNEYCHNQRCPFPDFMHSIDAHITEEVTEK